MPGPTPNLRPRLFLATTLACALTLLTLHLRSAPGLAQAPAPAPIAGVKPAENPHWKKESCNQCHAQAKAPFKSIDPKTADLLCLKCHNGHAAPAEAHPIARPIPPGKFDLPKSWPLSNGKLGCLTCHDMLAGCDPNLTDPLPNNTMLRTTATPEKPEQQPFCFSCHKPEQTPRHNPHAMLTSDRKPIADRCLDCHTEAPDISDRATAGKRKGQPLLREAQPTLCGACHLPHKEPFSPGHLNAKLTPDFLAFMSAREVVGLTQAPPKELIGAMKTAGQRPHLLSPAPDDRITCSTCHNPHQAGLFPSGTPLAYRPLRVQGPKALAPVRGEAWCNHCHDMN